MYTAAYPFGKDIMKLLKYMARDRDVVHPKLKIPPHYFVSKIENPFHMAVKGWACPHGFVLTTASHHTIYYLILGVLMRRDNSQATRTRLGQNLIRVSLTRNINESSRATRNSTRKAREKLEYFCI